jgi:cysteine desulfurase family protein (TIGR01976 family)
MNYDVGYIRKQFPALSLQVNGSPAAFFDGPGGTQVPQRVIDAVVNYMVRANANAGGAFLTSRESDRILTESRGALADFLGAKPQEISFGQNTTTLMFSLALALGREKGKRNEILITQLDHEANRGPWESLTELGFSIKEVKIHRDSCTVDMEDFAAKLSDKTRVAAFSYASNGVGTVSDVKAMAKLAREAGALSVVDAVHFALHGAIDVKDLGVDFLLCSAYKFFGPHLGVFYGREEAYEVLQTYRLKVQSHEMPEKIETGTLNFEGIAGAGEAVEFIADVGEKFGSNHVGEEGLSARRQNIIAGMKAMEDYEQPLADYLRGELSRIPGVKIYGPPNGHPRTSTVSFTMANCPSPRVAELLGEKGLFVWAGHFYAHRLVELLGLEKEGGLVRVGLSPYNTREEIERLLTEVQRISAGGPAFQ